jgi:hypothetical protein
MQIQVVPANTRYAAYKQVLHLFMPGPSQVRHELEHARLRWINYLSSPSKSRHRSSHRCIDMIQFKAYGLNYTTNN